ncbi:unnamed protein product [Effrenium voratum]|uniref:Uncharacterized protein n=1 Tax=Effrenium voratum TaxID=2562239 RepID=A0AA36IDD7_9DINO|nr:unnamed protein product [Effrenium voratum]
MSDSLRCSSVSLNWRMGTQQPEAFARQMRLQGDDAKEPPLGLRRLLATGALRRVELVEMRGAGSWFPDVLTQLPALRRLCVAATRSEDARKRNPKARKGFVG